MCIRKDKVKVQGKKKIREKKWIRKVQELKLIDHTAGSSTLQLVHMPVFCPPMQFPSCTGSGQYAKGQYTNNVLRHNYHMLRECLSIPRYDRL